MQLLRINSLCRYRQRYTEGKNARSDQGRVYRRRHGQVLAYPFNGHRYDRDSQLRYMEASVERALKHPEIGPDFTRYLAALIEDRKL